MSEREVTTIREAHLRKWNNEAGDCEFRRVWIVENCLGPPTVVLSLVIAKSLIVGAVKIVTRDDAWVAAGMWRDKDGTLRGSAEPRDVPE